MAELQNEIKETSLVLKNREILNLTGIEDVISFDENERISRHRKTEIC